MPDFAKQNGCNLDVAKQTVLTVHSRVTLFFFFVCIRSRSVLCFLAAWRGADMSTDIAYTHTRESKVPAPPAPHAPNVTSQMFCNVTVCPAIDQALGV
jgi:hypothetical protein